MNSVKNKGSSVKRNLSLHSRGKKTKENQSWSLDYGKRRKKYQWVSKSSLRMLRTDILNLIPFLQSSCLGFQLMLNLYPEHVPPQPKVFKSLNAGDRPCLSQLNPGLTCHQHQFKLHWVFSLFFFFLNYSLIVWKICCEYKTHLGMVHLGCLRTEKTARKIWSSQGVREKQGKLGVSQDGYDLWGIKQNSKQWCVLAMIFYLYLSIYLHPPIYLYIEYMSWKLIWS